MWRLHGGPCVRHGRHGGSLPPNHRHLALNRATAHVRGRLKGRSRHTLGGWGPLPRRWGRRGRCLGMPALATTSPRPLPGHGRWLRPWWWAPPEGHCRRWGTLRLHWWPETPGGPLALRSWPCRSGLCCARAVRSCVELPTHLRSLLDAGHLWECCSGRCPCEFGCMSSYRARGPKQAVPCARGARRERHRGGWAGRAQPAAPGKRPGGHRRLAKGARLACPLHCPLVPRGRARAGACAGGRAGGRLGET